MSWTAYAVKALTGAVVGYTTNDLAIQMLFKKRFGLGGIFLKTHDEFVVNISKLVERDIINHQTLLPQLENPAFRTALEQTVQTYLDSKLKASIDDELTLAAVPQFDKTVENIRRQAASNLPLTVEPLLLHLSKQTTLGDAASAKQWDKVSHNIINELTQGVQEWHSLEKLLKDFLEEIGEQTPADFIHPDLQETIRKELHLLTADLHLLLEAQHKESIEGLINQTFEDLEIEELVEKLAQRISKKRLIDILGEEKAIQLGNEVLKRLQDILSTEEGIEIIDVFSDFLIQTIEQEDKTVFELLAPDAKLQLENFFKHQFPSILVKVIGWLYSRQRELELLIDQTFTNSVESGFKNWLVKVFVGSISQSTDIIGKVTSIIDSYRRNPEQVASELTEQVVEYLESKSIGEMVSGLKTQNTVVSLSKILRKNINDSLHRLDVSPLVKLFLEKEVGGFVPTEKLIPFLLRNLNDFRTDFTKKLIFNPKFSERLSDELQVRLDSVLKTPINSLITAKQRQQLAINFEDWTVKQVSAHHDLATDFLAKNISERVKDQPLSKLISADQIEDLSVALTKRVDTFVEEFLTEQKNESLEKYFVRLEEFPNLSGDLSGVLHKFLLQNLDKLLTGRIEEIVQLNLSRQSPQQIRDIVERFMGKELKPITALGALWGGVAGGALAALPTLEPLALNYGVSALAYGATGLGTNWLALKMIFRPYSKKYLPATKIAVPLTPGIVIRNRERFAVSMSNFVGDKLMNEEGLKHSFEQSKERILKGAKSWVMKDDYALIYDYLDNHQHRLAKTISQRSWQWLGSQQEEMNSLLSKAVYPYQEFTLEGFDTSSFESTVLKYLQDDGLVSLVSDKIFKQTQNYLSKSDTLDEALPASVRHLLYEKVTSWIGAEIDYFFKKLDSSEQVEKLTKRLNEEFAQKASDRSLESYLNKEQTKNIEQKLSDYLIEQLQDNNTQVKVFDFINKQVATEIAGEKKIGQLFDGSLLRLLTENIDYIIRKMIESGADWLASNSERVAQQVYEQAYNEQKAAFIYKKAIKKTAKELATEGIPNFLIKEIESVNRLVHHEVERIGEVSLEQVGIKLNPSYLEKTVSQLLSNQTTQSAIRSFTAQLLQTLFQTPLSTFISATDIHSLDDLQNLLQSELKIAGRHLQTHYFAHREELQEKPKQLFISIIESILQKDENLLKRINHDALKSNIQQVSQRIFKSAALDAQGRRVVALLFERLKKIPANQLVDWKILQDDIKLIIQKHLQNDENKMLFEEGLAMIIQKNAIPLLQNIPNETKEFVLDTLLKAALDALQEELPSILSSIPIKDVVVHEISQMPPQEIEELFNSFAKKYFDRLVQYGFGFGLVFGLLIDGGISVATQVATEGGV